MTNLTTIELLEKLIAFDTTSNRSNLLLVNFIEEYLSNYGIDVSRFTSEDEEKANLYATIGPENKRGIILSGHMDTVPVIGQNWSTNPYKLTMKDDLLYGRGTADMKGFIASILASVPKIIAAKLPIPIHLALSYDEEVGCIGVRSLINYLSEQSILPLGCIVGEPTLMHLTLSHKGKVALRVKVKGKACHSGMSPLGVNAIHYANRLMALIDKKTLEYSYNTIKDDRFSIPHTTMQIGVVNGGSALNIVPENCVFDFEIRNIPADDPNIFIAEFEAKAKVLVQEMQLIDQSSEIELEWLIDYPGLSMSDDDPFVQIVIDALGHNKIEKISFGTEGGLFQSQLQIPVVICGPGDMAQGHQPDEFISIAQLERCDQFLESLIGQLKLLNISNFD